MPTERPYGLWPSPITPKMLARSQNLYSPTWDDGGALLWVEARPDRTVLVCAPPGGDAPFDLTTELSPRGKILYGGGELAARGGVVVFAERGGRLYRQGLSGGGARPITPPFGGCSSPTIAPDGRWVAYLHTTEGHDVLAVVDAEGRRWPRVLAEGADFYLQPAWSADSARIAWVQWHHPQMPWDGSELMLAAVDSSGELPCLQDVRLVAGGPAEAIFQPAFAPDGSTLAYISDADGWSHIYLRDLASGETRQLTRGAFDVGAPSWVAGLRTYAWRADGSIAYLRNERGFRTLWEIAPDGSERQIRGLGDYTWIESTLALHPASGQLALIASAATTPPRLVTLDSAGGKPRVLARSSGERVAPSQLSAPRPLSWEVARGIAAHGLYYPPASGDFHADGPPPAVITIHGGPTSQATAAYDDKIQFFTTRGYAVLDLNYRGSTGYGRDYMLALREQWGVADVEDAASAARYLAQQGLADERRIVIMGRSAGGYTVLQALVHHPGLFRAGISAYGISNLLTLEEETHKFEERYNHSLIGPFPAEHARYRERSPLFAAERISDPLLIFQGDEDRVVPRGQSDAIVAALRRRGVTHEYHVFQGEGHGWRKPETIIAYYEAIERFLRTHVVFS